MRLLRLHHRLAVGMGLAAVAAFAGGAAAQPLTVGVALAALALALLWQPDEEQSRVLQRVFGIAAVVLVARAGYLIFLTEGDRLEPMIQLLLLLLVAESIKAPASVNDLRLYTLSFALLLASTVYRPGVVFAFAFVAYVGLATLAVMIGHLRRKAARFGVRDVQVDRRFLYGTALLSLMTLIISGILFLAFPRVSRGWMSGGRAFATSIAGFADEVSLAEHGARIYGNPSIVLRVEFRDGPPPQGELYWRGRSYDHFDGVRWTHSARLPPSSPRSAFYEQRWSGRVVRQEIYGAPLESRVLFGLHPALDVSARSRIRVLRDAAGDLRYRGGGPPIYGMTSYLDPPPPELLRQAGPQSRRRMEHYRQLPELPESVIALADSLTAGEPTLYDRVRAVERWFHQEFDYTLELPATPEEAELSHFLFERRAGHCEYFSSGMVVLLRSVGIAARNVNGFLGGEWNEVGQYLAVTQNQAHSWVEVWFPSYGWVAFDPTPAGSGESAAGDLSWFWPGRLLLDGVQHRWNKWVLDYNLDRQLTLFERTASLVDGGEARAPSGRASEEGRSWLPVILLLAALLAAVWLLLGPRGRAVPPETRLYLKLRGAYDARGYEPPSGPLAFARALRAAEAPGAGAAERAVRLYVESRFGGREMGEAGLQRMRKDVRRARRAVRQPR